MKKILTILAAAATLFASCKRNELAPNTYGNENLKLDISVSNPCSETKAFVKTAWAEDDRILIWYDTNSGTDPDLVIKYNGSTWENDAAATVSGNTPSVSGDAKAVFDGAVKVAAKDSYTYVNGTLSFHLKTWTFLTELQVVVSGLTSEDYANYTLACDRFTPCTGYTVGEGSITASVGTKGAAADGISNADGVAFVFATADYAETAADFKFTLTDSASGASTFTKNSVLTRDTTKINAIKIANSSFEAVTPAEPEYVEITMTVGGQEKIYKWAKCNLGAEKETDYGDYYAWGTTVKAYSAVDYSRITGAFTFVSSNPYGDIYKNSWDASKGFNWVNTPFTNGVYSYDNKKVFTKYVTTDKETEYWNGTGSADNKTTLDLADDVANKVLGGNWRMPTKEEFDALLALPTKAWKSDYQGSGVNGYLFTDKNSHSIFLPAAGYGKGTGLSYAGEFYYYWSSSLYTSPYGAYSLYFDDSGAHTDGCNRFYGYSIRPIKAEAAPAPTPTLPDGALPGVFTVGKGADGTAGTADDVKVYFSKGNLQATYSTANSAYNWDFAAHQYDFIGNAAGNTTIGSQSDGAVVDLFGWSTSSTTYGINTSEIYNDYSGEFVDWGKAYCEKNSIAEGTWRTLSTEEWVYLFNTRMVNGGTGDGYSYKRATINSDVNSGVYGMILYPDNYTETAKASYTSADWATAEGKGCVFLPAAGYRFGSDVFDANGRYWSSTESGNTARAVNFNSSTFYPSSNGNRNQGYSVRLVTNASAAPAPTPTTKGTAKRTGDIDVNWVQLWTDGPKFAEYNVEGTMTFTQAIADPFTWGANWCTPSKADLEHLMTAAKGQTDEKVKCEYTQEGSQWGFKFTGKETGYTGNSVFFPAQGGNSFGGNANYWSGTANGSEAWDMRLSYDFDYWGSDWNSYDQDDDWLVRPVLKN